MKRKETKQKLAVFDIDGTIFRKNLHFELINQLVWMRVFPLEVRTELTRVYSHWLTHEGTYEEYRQALVDLYSKYIAGVSSEEVARACTDVIPFHAKRTYIFSESLIKELRRKNYRLIVISGSPIEIVEEYNRHYLKFDDAFGSVYALDKDGRYTGEASLEPSRNKAQVVEDYIGRHGLSLAGSYGIGDTESDIRFLELVENPIAFNPNANLKKAAEAAGWRIVVEKKDVVYEIGNRHE